jgi:hypothetical protein
MEERRLATTVGGLVTVGLPKALEGVIGRQQYLSQRWSTLTMKDNIGWWCK